MTKKQFLVGTGGFVGILLVAVIITQVSRRPIPLAQYGYDDEASGSMALGVAAPSFMKGGAGAEAQREMLTTGENSASDSPTTEEQDRLIIKTGSLSLVVSDVRVAIDTISDFAEKKGGFVVNSNISKADVAPYGEITIRIPVEIFDSGIGEIKNLGDVESESTHGQDVTEEYVDLQARLGNLQATEQQFLDIMKRAVKIEDVLAVQRELSNVRGQIESLKGRMQYLEKSAALSTLTVYLSPNPESLPVLDEQNEWKPIGVIKDAIRSLIDVGKGLVNVIIWILIYTPVWVVLVGIVWLVYRFIKKRLV